ncbi:MAG: hypothetical protein JW950_05855 [Deltaproteobacteria bacterium]|nr:hypothetical protein [Deltaproteobacteria bacterium]
MISDRNKYLIVALPIVALVLLLYLSSKVRFDAPLTPQETRLLGFSEVQSVPSVLTRKPAVVASIRNPITVPKLERVAYPGVPLAMITPPVSQQERAPAERNLSFIMINPSKKIAIIDGRLVNEGSVIGEQRVKKIEESKVLLTNGKGEDIWLKLR